MSKAAKSLLYSGLYLIIIGIVLFVAPKIVLPTLSVLSIWVRAAGILLLMLGYYCIATARNGDREGIVKFFRRTAPIRFSISLFLIIFGAIGFANPIIIIFGLIDLLAIVWTVIALWQIA